MFQGLRAESLTGNRPQPARIAQTQYEKLTPLNGHIIKAEAKFWSFRFMKGSILCLRFPAWTLTYLLTDAETKGRLDGQFYQQLTLRNDDDSRIHFVLLDKDQRVVSEIKGRKRYVLASRRAGSAPITAE